MLLSVYYKPWLKFCKESLLTDLNFYSIIFCQKKGRAISVVLKLFLFLVRKSEWMFDWYNLRHPVQSLSSTRVPLRTLWIRNIENIHIVLTLFWLSTSFNIAFWLRIPLKTLNVFRGSSGTFKVVSGWKKCLRVCLFALSQTKMCTNRSFRSPLC